MTRTRPPKDDRQPIDDAVTPPPSSYRHVLDTDTALTMLMEFQRSIGEMKSEVSGLTKAVNGVKEKVDTLVAWKNKILGGAAVVGILGTILGFAIAKVLPYVHFGPPTSTPTAVSQPAESGQVAPKPSVR